MPTLLALDTSTERLVVALRARDSVSVIDEDGAARSSMRIVPAALELMQRAGVAMRDLDAIAFGRGPGAFTGLRTACAVAQGLAFGAAKPVLPVDSLLIVADDAREQLDASSGFETWVAMDARMDQVYAAAYRWQDGRWQAFAAPALYDLDALHARWQDAAPRTIAGSAPAAFGDRLRLGDARTVLRVQDRGGALLRIADALWHDGGTVDAEQALPLYLRDKVALTTAEREEATR